MRAFAQILGQRVQIFHQHAATLGQPLPFGSGMQAARGSVQQAHAQLAFQALETLAGHRHRQIQAARARGDRAQVEHAQEQGNVAKTVHPILND